MECSREPVFAWTFHKRMKTLTLLVLAAVNLIHCQDDGYIVDSFRAVLEKLEGMKDILKDVQKNLGNLETDIQDMQQKQGNLEAKIHDMQQKLGNLDTNFFGLSEETGQRLRGDDLKHLTNVSAAAHQEIKTFIHKEISGVISLAQKDECSEGSHPCGPIGLCNDLLFGFTCSCPSGFTWEGSECTDIDECIQGKADCSTNQGICTNTLGSYSCSCNPPFEGDGRTCSCPPGFASKGDFCEDIDECAEGRGVCSPKAICKNSIGSYSCFCNKPLEGDGRTSCVWKL